MEVGGVCRVDGIAAEATTRGHDPEWRLTGKHRAHLDARRVGAQHEGLFTFTWRVGRAESLRHVERILHVTRGVIGGRVECVETMPLRFNLGTLGDREAELTERSENPLARTRQRVEGTRGSIGAGERGIPRCAQGSGNFGVLDLKE